MKVRNYISRCGFCFLQILMILMICQVTYQSYGAEKTKSLRAVSGTPQLLKVANDTDFVITILNIKKEGSASGTGISPRELEKIKPGDKAQYRASPGELGRLGKNGHGRPAYEARIEVYDPKNNNFEGKIIRIGDEADPFETTLGIGVRVNVYSSGHRTFKSNDEEFTYLDKNIVITQS